MIWPQATQARAILGCKWNSGTKITFIYMETFASGQFPAVTNPFAQIRNEREATRLMTSCCGWSSADHEYDLQQVC